MGDETGEVFICRHGISPAACVACTAVSAHQAAAENAMRSRAEGLVGQLGQLEDVGKAKAARRERQRLAWLGMQKTATKVWAVYSISECSDILSVAELTEVMLDAYNERWETDA